MTPITQEEKSIVLRTYRKLLKACQPIMEKGDDVLIRKALEISVPNETETLRRASGDLSVQHALEVALILVNEVGMGRTAIICALLYDAVLDKKITADEIEKLYGIQAAGIVKGLVKVDELYAKKTSIENENFRKLLLTFAHDIRVVLIIIADKLRTMRTLGAYNQADQIRLSGEVAYLYAPMAHRLGLYNIKSEMEDLVMKYTNREMYTSIAQKLNENKRARDKYIAEFIAPLEKELQAHGFDFEIKGRTKTIHSIWNKLKNQNTPFEQVFDLFAIRVILNSAPKNEKSECWQVYSIVTDKYQPNPSRMRDWISVPKSNGYESLHTTVLGPDKKWVEVQIRTHRMNEIAEKGLAAHWKYKGIKGERGMDEWLSNVREILENPELNAVDFIEDFKLDLYEEEVFVFTPKGDLRRLKKGSTVLDFAFDIHTDVGKKCVGAKVNNRNVPIKHKLQNGDHVDIQTSVNQTPKPDWINIVVTSKAISKLKQTLREMQYKEAELGREMLGRRLKNWKFELTDQVLNLMVKHFGYKVTHDFLAAIVSDKIDFMQIKEFIINTTKKEPEQPELANERSATNFVNDVVSDDDVLIIDQTLTKVDYSLAKCCSPVFGDDVFGFVASTGGIKIHRNSCPNAPEMRTKFSYRVVNAQWTIGSDAKYQATLKVTGTDDIGIVTNISQLINKEQKIKLRSISIDSNEGFFEGTLTVFVDNISSLTLLIKKIKNIKGVYTVSRVGSEN